MKLLRLFLPLMLGAAAPALASDMADPAVGENRASVRVTPQLDAAERDNYRAVFAALRSSDWAGAAGRLDGMGDGPLHDVARAMLYTLPGSPRVEQEPLTSLYLRAPELPQAADLLRIATARGATALPAPPQAQRLVGLPGQPRRPRPRPLRGDAVADLLEPLIQPLIVDNRPTEAEALFTARAHELSDEARTAFGQRIAWSYYLTGADREAYRVADQARHGPTEWALHADWVAGLAAWRMGNCNAATQHFDRVGMRGEHPELMAAGHYWASRAEMKCGRADRVQLRLRNAARLDETFYGMLAESALGVRKRPAEAAPLTEAEWRQLKDERNVRRAVALAEIGEDELAGTFLRHQARIGDPRLHSALVHLAARLNLTSTQMWLAHNGPRGAAVTPQDRYPRPDWRPDRGWRVEEALVFAHALQESNFRPEAVSPAGARGLMQVRPGTAGDIVRWRGVTADPSRLSEPRTNLEFGQAYLEHLRDFSASRGLLINTISAYNAGPGVISDWHGRGLDNGDPLLFIESIPYWETRGYVPIVLRNYWMYEQKPAEASPSRRALVQGLWPRFPGTPGPTAIRIERAPRPTAMGQQ